MSDHGAEAKPTGCLKKMSHAVESRMTAFFSRLGELVAIHPGKTIILAIIGEIAAAIGGGGG